MKRSIFAIAASLSLLSQTLAAATPASIRPVAAPVIPVSRTASPATPMPANFNKILPQQGWSGGSIDADTYFAKAPLGEPAILLISRLGNPNVLAHGDYKDFLAYRMANGEAFFVVTLKKGIVESAQVTDVDHYSPSIYDSAGVSLGEDASEAKAKLGQPTIVATPRPLSSAMLRRVSAARPQGASELWRFDRGQNRTQFVGLDASGVVERFGYTSGSTAMPMLLRWYRLSGWGPSRAVPYSSKTSTDASREDYVESIGALPEFSWGCSSRYRWHIVSEKSVQYDGNEMLRASVECGNTAYKRSVYFQTHPTDPEQRVSQLVLVSIAGQKGWSGAAGETRAPNLGQRAITPSDSASQKIYFNQPPPPQMYSDADDGAEPDWTFTYVDNPSDPIANVEIEALPGASSADAAVASYSTTKRRATVRADISPILINGCAFSGGSGKCWSPVSLPNGLVCYIAIFTTQSGAGGSSPSVCGDNFSDAGQQNPHNPGQCACGQLGEPVNVINGSLYYDHADAELSGPSGQHIGRTYDSLNGTVQASLGMGWRDSYDFDLDTTQLSQGLVTLNLPDSSREYFGGMYGPSSSSSDQETQDILSETSSGFVLNRFRGGTTIAFNTAGQATSITDRVGNIVTVSRGSNGEITTITDPLGRTLTYSYDSSGRVSSIASSPAGVTVTYTYDSGTNCYPGDLCKVTEPDGGTWTYEYVNPAAVNQYHLLQSVIDPNGEIQEQNSYGLTDLDVDGAIYASTSAPSSPYLDNHYRIASQSLQGGAETYSFAYSATASDQSSATGYGVTGTTVVTDGLGRTSTYTWNGLNQTIAGVSGVACNCSGGISYIYDDFGRVVQQHNPNPYRGGNNVAYTFSYGRDGMFSSFDGTTSYATNPYPGATQFTIPATGLVENIAYYAIGDPRQDLVQQYQEASVVSPSSNATTTLNMSQTGLLQSLERTGLSTNGTTTSTTSWTYDSRGRVLTKTGPRTDLSQIWTYSYYPDTDGDFNRRGQLKQISDPLGNIYKLASGSGAYDTYNRYGEPLSSSDANGLVTEFTYNPLGLVTGQSILAATVATTSTTYNSLGQPTNEKDALGNSVQFGYSPQEKLASITRFDASGLAHEKESLSYDAMDEVSGLSYASCVTPASTCGTWSQTYGQTSTYDTYGGLASITDAEGRGSTYSNSFEGNYQTTTYGSGNGAQSYTTTYNTPLNIPTTIAAPYETYNYSYDTHARWIGESSPYQASISRQFDDFGNVLSETTPFGGGSTYQYDAAGNLVKKIFGDGSTAVSTFDAVNRPLVTTYTSASGAQEVVTRTYDNRTAGQYGIGRLYSISDPSGSTTFTYSALGSIATRTQNIGTATYRTTYTYNSDNETTAIALPSGTTLAYTYDFAGRPATAKYGSTSVVSSAKYNPFGPLTMVKFGNGVQEQWAYDGAYGLSAETVTANSGKTTLSSLSFTETNAGYVASQTDNLNSAYSLTNSYSGNQTVFSSNSQCVQHNYLFSYSQTAANAFSTIVTQPTWNSGCTNSGVSYGNVNGMGFNPPTQLGSSATTSDSNGNVTAVGSETYAYSPRKNLSSVDGVAFTYDGLGHRVQANGGALGTINSVYDTQSGHLLEESSLTSTTPEYDYVWFGNMPVAEATSGSVSWDADTYQLAPFLQTNSSGAVTWQADYDALGGIADLRTADAHQPLRLPGQEAEELAPGNGNGATTPYYNGARWYLHQYGLYTQPDPLYLNTDTPGYPDASLYGYVNLNPLNFVDPSGTTPIPSLPGFSLSEFGGGGGAVIDAGVTAGEEATVFGAGEVVDPLGGGIVAVGGLIALDELSQLAGHTGNCGNAPGGNPSVSSSSQGPGVPSSGNTEGFPTTFARVVPSADAASEFLGKPGNNWVFVTDADELITADGEYLSSDETAQLLGLEIEKGPFSVIEFPSSTVSNIAQPISYDNPMFVGNGYTINGGSEFVIPNQPLPPGAIVRPLSP